MKTTRRVRLSTGLAGVVVSLGVAALGGAQEPTEADWAQYNHDNLGWRYNPAETALSPETVRSLVEKWRFPRLDSELTIGPVHASPVVVDGFVYFGTARPGAFFKLTPDGRVAWQFDVPPTSVPYVPEDEDARASTESSLVSWSVGNSALVTARSVFFATVDGQVFCLDRDAGTPRWTLDTRLAPFPGRHELNSFWSSPILADGKLIMAGGAIEQAVAGVDPDYECCTGRGFVLALAPETGELLWKWDLGPEPQRYAEPLVVDHGKAGTLRYVAGPATSTIWSTPTYDEVAGLIFFGTDTNNSPRQPTDDDARLYNGYSSAVVAVDVRTGEEGWVRQLVENDVWHVATPGWDPRTGQYKDVTIGDSPKLYEWKGAPVVGVGCKNGAFYVLDRGTGEILHHTPFYQGPPIPELRADATTRILAMPSALGGLQTGCAFDGSQVITNGIDWLGLVKGSLSGLWMRHPPAGGRVAAIQPDTLVEHWRHERPQLTLPRLDEPTILHVVGDPVASGIAVANDVAYFTTTMSNQLVALDARDGSVLAEIPVGPVWSGPVVSRGRVYVGTGNIILEGAGEDTERRFEYPISETGAVISFGMAGRDEVDALPDTEAL